MNAKKQSRATSIFIGLFVLFVVFRMINPLVTVGAGERAVVFSLSGGTRQGQLDEGTHLIIPFLQRAVFYDTRVQTYTMSGTKWEGEIKGDDSLKVLTSDGQEVKIEISIRFHPDRDKIFQLHQRIGQDYVNKIIRPAVRSQTRVVIASYPVSDVYSTKRAEIERKIGEGLRDELGRSDIVLDEALLRDVAFSDAYAKAIEGKQIAQQQAQKMQYVLQTTQKEKEQRILQAEGEARAIELKGQAIAQNSRVVQYEYARKIAPNVGTIITDGKNVQVPFAAPAPKAGG